MKKETSMRTLEFMKWFLINAIIISAVVIGIEYNFEIVKLIGEVFLWVTAVGGTAIGIAVYISHAYFEKKGSDIYLVDYSLLSEKEATLVDDSNAITLHLKDVEKMAYGSVPKLTDFIGDMVITLILINYNYFWLTLLYLGHMIALWYIREKSEDLIENNVYELKGELNVI